jgi:hypothetical protein
MSTLTGRPEFSASAANAAEAVAAPTQVRNPPRVPRREQISATQSALTLLLGFIALGLIAATTFLWPVVHDWISLR